MHLEAETGERCHDCGATGVVLDAIIHAEHVVGTEPRFHRLTRPYRTTPSEENALDESDASGLPDAGGATGRDAY